MRAYQLVAVSIILLLGLSSFKINKNEFEGRWWFSPYTGFYEKVEFVPRKRSYFVFTKDGKLDFKQSKDVCGLQDEKEVSKEGNWKVTSDSTIAVEYNTCIDRTFAVWVVSRGKNGKIRFKLSHYAGDYE